MKPLDDRLGDLRLEVDRHIAKQDQVQSQGARERRGIDIFDQIQIGKANVIPNPLGQTVFAPLAVEVVGVVVDVGPAKRPVAIAPGPRPFEELGVQIGGQNRDVSIADCPLPIADCGRLGAESLVQEDRQRFAISDCRFQRSDCTNDSPPAKRPTADDKPNIESSFTLFVESALATPTPHLK